MAALDGIYRCMTDDGKDDLFNSDPRAASIEGVIAALTIFAKHANKGMQQAYFCQGEHDIIHFFFDTKQIPEDSEDGRALIALGFHLEFGDQWAMFT